MTYIALSEGEVRAVMEQQRRPVPSRTAGGEQLHPLALRLLHSGLLLVGAPRVEGIPAGGMFKPYVKLVVRVVQREAETDAAQASRTGVAEFSRPAALHLELETLRQQGAQGGLGVGWGGAGMFVGMQGLEGRPPVSLSSRQPRSSP